MPLCNVTLQMTDGSAVEVECCRTCCGVWLDRWHFDNFLKMLYDSVVNPNVIAVCETAVRLSDLCDGR